MKRLAISVLVLALATALPLLAESRIQGRGPRVVTRPGASADAAAVAPKATAAGYSVQVNVVTRVQGTSLFKTAIDVTNNTETDGVTASFQYCYNTAAGFQGCTVASTIGPLHPLDNFHQDDMVQYIGSLGLIDQTAQNSSFGTMLVTFAGLPSNHGWEGTVTARTYSPVSTGSGTVAIAYPGSLFFESASLTLVGIIRDTTEHPTDAGALRTNLGVTNTDIFGFGPVNAQITYYDVTPNSPTAGTRVGDIVNISNLAAGEVRQFNNVFVAHHIPSGIDSCIAFIDVTSSQPDPQHPATIEGYIVDLDGGTQDGAFFEMKCSAGCATF
jgi:hypothetical protein